MLASVEKGFVLLSNPKSGTTALEAAFERFAGIRTGGTPKWKHLNFERMTEVFGDYFQRQGCTIYGVARHPVDTLVSWYRYRSRPTARRAGEPYTGGIPFSQFAEEWNGRATPRARVPVSVKWCMTRDGTPAPMTFYRYEDLGRLHEALVAHVGEPVALERRNRSPERPLDLDRAAVAALPRMQAFLEAYATIPFAGPFGGSATSTSSRAAGR